MAEMKAKMKAIGRRSSIDALVRKYGEEADPNKDDAVFISHGDCYDDAKLLEKLLYDTYGTEVLMISNVGSVIGSHSGPGTLALFFIGKQNGRGEA